MGTAVAADFAFAVATAGVFRVNRRRFAWGNELVCSRNPKRFQEGGVSTSDSSESLEQTEGAEYPPTSHR